VVWRLGNRNDGAVLVKERKTREFEMTDKKVKDGIKEKSKVRMALITVFSKLKGEHPGGL
jgi:hypothetical protein